jgi:hypothetical protein
VSADITDATSDGQSNPGKVLKTDVNGALQIEQLTLGNSADGVAGSVGIVGAENVSYIANPDDSAIDLKFGTTSGAILSTGDASATFSSGKAILWASSADATLTNLGGGTAGKAIFGAATYTGTGSVRKLAGLDVDDNVSFSSVSASSPGATNTLAGVTVIGTSGSIQPSSDTARSVGTAARRFGNVHAVTGNFSDLKTIGYIEGTEMTAPAVPAANGYRIFAEDNGSGKTRLMVQFATGAAQQIAIEP